MSKKYLETGVTLCVNTVKYPVEWVLVLLEQMAQLGLNQLTLECKIKFADWEHQHTWPYYTETEISTILTAARERGIDVIPLINAPAHMETWLMRAPQYAIQNKDGITDNERLNFITEAGVQFYCELIDRYLHYFTSPYWHMGADEFDYRVTYADYPQILAYAQEKFGAQAQPEDAFIEFINKINSYVKSRGKTLRIWNDGMRESAVISVDKDVVVDYWLNRGLSPQAIIDAGYKVVNVPQYMYLSRSVPFYGFRGEKVYQSENWDLTNFDAGPAIPIEDVNAGLPGTDALADGGVTLNVNGKEPVIDYRGVPVDDVATAEFPHRLPVQGLRCALWPDIANMQTDRQVLAEAREVLGYLGHIVAGGSRQWDNWEQAKQALYNNTALLDLVNWETTATFAPGVYHLPELQSLGLGPWQISRTEDAYYTFLDLNSGKQLVLCTGESWLGVVNEIGAAVELGEVQEAVPVRAQHAGEYNMRKFAVQIVQDANEEQSEPRILISPALTHMQLVLKDGKVVQMPCDKITGTAGFAYQVASCNC